MPALSPLRYPGGKQILVRVLATVLRMNERVGGTYVEPYAGGGGAALALLFGEYVDRIVLNDADRRVYAFWQAVLEKTEKFLRLLRDTPVTVDEWRRQRAVYLSPARHSALRLGFATFYLNRCNRSGIIANAGPIGGKNQVGKWKIDARYNREDLACRVERVALYKERIELFNLDAIEFLRCVVESRPERTFVYLDPPYFTKGSQLYLNHYTAADHAALATHLCGKARFPWVLSYDDVPAIHDLYAGLRQIRFSLGYSVRDWRIGSEVLILRDGIHVPPDWSKGIPKACVSAAR